MGPDEIGGIRAPRKRGRPRHFRPTRRKPPIGVGGQKSSKPEVASDLSTAAHPEPPPEPLERFDEPAETETRDVDYRQEEEVADSPPPRPSRRPERRHYDEPRPPRERREPPRERKPAVAQAIQHVEQIVEDLKSALDDMELVLELIEEAERQQIDDDREISALKKALDRVNRFRTGPRSSE